MKVNLQKFIQKQMLHKKLNEELSNDAKLFYSQAFNWLSAQLSKNTDNIVAAYEKANTVGGNRGNDMVKVLNTVCNYIDAQAKKLSESKINEDDLPSIDEEMDALNEDGEPVSAAAESKPMTEEELKIESLKIATNIAKLMSDVTTDDIITIADKVSGFIRDHQIGSDDSKSEESSDIADELQLPSDEENNSEEKEENTEV